MSDLKHYIERQMNDPEFKAEYDASETEYQLTRSLIAARIASKELADKSGVRQSNISRIESGSCSPTVATLQALAEGLGKKLVISFR